MSARFLKERGYQIIETNYRKKWGELDIVAEKDNILHFVEVKSLTWRPDLQVANGSDDYMPEANMRLWKRQRMTRAIKTYLLDRKVPDDKEFQIDIMAVFLDFARKDARIRVSENVILS